LLGIVYPGRHFAVGMTPTYIEMKPEPIYDASGNDTDRTFNYQGLILPFAVSCLLRNAAIGTSVKYYSEEIGSYAQSVTTVDIGQRAGNEIHEDYNINIHVTDPDGGNLSGVTVDLYGSDSGSASEEYDTAMWTEGSVTTAEDGTITEQTITARKWVGTSETLTNYNYFKMVLSKASYKTRILENITIDSPIDWHLELQPIEHPPAPWEHNI